ncbi:M28 family metallopeptidase [Spirillospora sp. NPDC047279]|uniref:M28 family metallopeptidase n=1 Tax=Spirillospora sp. NPDC047279 TaxID=3155478 RepID=UPI0033F994A0
MHLRGTAYRATAVATLAALPLGLTTAARAEPRPDAFATSIPVAAVERHLEAFQEIADAHGGTRASGTPGYAASRDYVAGLLRKAGYDVSVQPFEFPFYRENSTPTLERVSPKPKSYKPTLPDGSVVGDFATMVSSRSGDVTATVQGVDLLLPPPAKPRSTSGCEASDFSRFKPGNIALLQRGTCDFKVKAVNAQAAGASAVIIFNEGQSGRTDTLLGRITGADVTIPVVGADFALGKDLASPAGTVARIRTDTESEVRTTWNVLAESTAGDAGKVVMSGAHLDSVLAGPGINDNGSGSAALLEVALRMGESPVKNKTRFAWWGAEELGLLGSEHYVEALPRNERDRIRLYLNYDMAASPNHMLGIYDGDDSDKEGAPAGPPGSDAIEKTFERYFDARRVPHTGTDFSGRSDYGPFIKVGIPAGGLFTGAEGLKTAEEAKKFGGTAKAAYDACYHLACDTTANISPKALLLNTGAIAHATITYANATNLPGPQARSATRRITHKTVPPHPHDHHITH